ncbi:MAG: DUF1616 domain-containing protein [Methanomicrobiaceae archaeon]|nr:DUF1616 domain-containing protein [Methanomicrobiaceae archaeon]
MTATHRLRTRLRNLVNDDEFFDLQLLLLLTVGALIVMYMPLVNETALRVLFTIPLILFIPGYALISLLFPLKEQINPLERFILAVGMSFALAALIGLMLNYTPWGIRLETVSAALCGFSWFTLIVAYYRRALVDPALRFSVSFGRLVRACGAVIAIPGPDRHRFLSHLLALSILLALATTVLVMAAPKEGEKFSEFYILGENGQAIQYPRKITLNEPQHLLLGIGNHEYRDVEYLIEVFGVRVNTDLLSNTTRIDSMQLLDRFSLSLASGQELERSYAITMDSGEFNRIDLLLFTDDVPSDDIQGMERIAASYRNLHIWVDISS